MAPKSKRIQKVENDNVEKEASKHPPLLIWQDRDPCTSAMNACPIPRCYCTSAMYENKLFVFGGWNGESSGSSLKSAGLAAKEAVRSTLNMIETENNRSASISYPTSKPGSLVKELKSKSKISGINTSKDAVSALEAATPCISIDAANSMISTAVHSACAQHPHRSHCREIMYYDFTNNIWSVESNCIGVPHPGTSQAAAADLGDTLLFFGGWDGFKRYNTVTIFSFQDMEWKAFPTTGEEPPAVSFHGCCGFGRRFFTFGGECDPPARPYSSGVSPAAGSISSVETCGTNLNGDMYILDINTACWSIAPHIGAPSKRTSHTMTMLLGAYVVVIGGRGADGLALSDIAVFDISNSHWIIGIKTTTIGGGSPIARYGHTACAINNNSIVVYGGMGPKALPNGSTSLTTPTKTPKSSDKNSAVEKEAANIVLQQAYIIHQDVWVLTMVNPNSFTWELAQVGSADAINNALLASNTTTTAYVNKIPTTGALNDSHNKVNLDNCQINPVPPRSPPYKMRATVTPRQRTPSANSQYGDTVSPQNTQPYMYDGSIRSARCLASQVTQAPTVALPEGRTGHCMTSCLPIIYIFGGRTGYIGGASAGVTDRILALDVSSLLPQPSATPIDEAEGNDRNSDRNVMVSSVVSQ